jgi:hypoxanthine phosphoribosyltransferase
MNQRAHSRTQQRRSTKAPKAHPGNNLRVAFTETEIRQRVRQLARQINRDYEGKSLHVVGVLDNCLVFMADLIRALKIPAGCSLISTRTRDSASGSVSMREISYVPPLDLQGKDILLLDGVLQSGVTLDYLSRMLLAQHPASLRTAALIDKADERKVDIPVDYSGFKVSGWFLVGYGLAYQEQYRGLPYLARMG